MRILFTTTYYRPHVSGLTIHVQRLAEGLAARGHGVTVLTSRYRSTLPGVEVAGGVRVARVPVLWRVGKGVITPRLPLVLHRAIAAHDVVACSIPANPDLVWWARRLAARHDRPLALVYACDVSFGDALRQRLLARVCGPVFRQALAAADGVLVPSADYAASSADLGGAAERTVAIPPPIEFPSPTDEGVAAIRARFGLRSDQRHVVLAARLASEKGVEHLLDALGEVSRRAGPTRLMITGDQSLVVGEQAYRRALERQLAACDPPVVFTGELSTQELANCFAAGDLTVLPSVNRTESFGMVQVESMLCGTPVVASDLPGVREPVRRTGMGALAPPRDALALAAAMIRVLADPAAHTRDRAAVARAFDAVDSIDRTERWLGDMVTAHRMRASHRRARVAGFREQARGVPAFRALVRSVEAQLVGAIGPFERPVLDLGAGDGHFAQALAAGIDVGLDPDASALREAHHRRVHGLLVRGDGASLPFRTGAFGTILANSTIEHVDALDRVLDEAVRVLRPGGRLVITAPSHRFGDMLAVPALARRLGLQRLAARYIRWFNAKSRHVTTDSAADWRARLGSRGLVVTRASYYLTPASHRAFDLLHYLSLPNLAARAVTGRWVVPPLGWPRWLPERWLARLVADGRDAAEGPYVLLVAERQ